jgi:hypothetical protein
MEEGRGAESSEYAEILGDVASVEEIAAGREIRELRRLIRRHGRGRWRKQ